MSRYASDGGGPEINISTNSPWGSSMPWRWGKRMSSIFKQQPVNPTPMIHPPQPIPATAQGVQQAAMQAQKQGMMSIPPAPVAPASVPMEAPMAATQANTPMSPPMPSDPRPGMASTVAALSSSMNRGGDVGRDMTQANLVAGTLPKTAFVRAVEKFAKVSAAGESGLALKDAGPIRNGKEAWDVSKFLRKEPAARKPNPFIGKH